MKPHLIILLSLASLVAAEPKTRLLFSIDQGFGNGIVANGNVAALNQMVTALEPLRSKHESPWDKEMPDYDSNQVPDGTKPGGAKESLKQLSAFLLSALSPTNKP